MTYFLADTLYKMFQIQMCLYTPAVRKQKEVWCKTPEQASGAV